MEYNNSVMENRAKFLIFKGEDNQWYFSLYANNNEIVCQSEGYKAKQSALDGVKAVCSAALQAKILIEQE